MVKKVQNTMWHLFDDPVCVFHCSGVDLLQPLRVSLLRVLGVALGKNGQKNMNE